MIVIKRAKRGQRKSMLEIFGKKHRCFGCGTKTVKVSRIVCIKEVGVLGLFYLQGILCKDCSLRTRKQMCEILVQKAYKKTNSESSIYNL